MARRILFVRSTSYYRDPDIELFVDAFVDVDWKLRMAIDDWTGDVETAPPTYKVRPREPYPSEYNEYGVLSEPADIQWLNSAMTKPAHDHSYKSITLLARVNQLGVANSKGDKGFNIEVLTSKDAESLIANERQENRFQFAKEHWWIIGLGLIVAC